MELRMEEKWRRNKMNKTIEGPKTSRRNEGQLLASIRRK